MPFAQSTGARIYWRADGPIEKPSLVLLNSIGTDMGLWDRALPYLVQNFRVLRLDTRGHGASDATNGDYSLPMLVDDMISVMDAAGVDLAPIAGVSLGGMIAMEAALRYPDRVSALGLICTSAAMHKTIWNDRVAKVRSRGTSEIVDLSMQRFFSPDFLENNAAQVARTRDGLLRMDDRGYVGSAAAIRDMNLLSRLPEISLPTLIVVGDGDISTPFQGHGDQLLANIPGAKILHLDAAHLAPLEDPSGVATALRQFLLD